MFWRKKQPAKMTENKKNAQPETVNAEDNITKLSAAIEKNTEIRNNILYKHIDVKKAKGLELGPLHAPQVDAKTHNMKYADLESREELVNNYRNDPNVAFHKIPEIDFIIDANTPSSSINETFDYIIANHVIEHSPNPLLYLQELSKLLNKGGVLFMAVPQKTKTFDKERPLTAFEHLVDDYYNNTGNHDCFHLFEWNRYVGCKNMSLADVYKHTLEAAKHKNSKSHIHYHVFSIENFETIINQIIALGILDFKLVSLEYPPESGEFYLIMRKNK